jgi:chaperonin GroEL
MHKELILKDELNPKIQSGLTKIAAMVKRTLGPGGLPIIIQRVGQGLTGEPLGPKITKDGVSVANECSSPDEIEDLIIQTVKHICKKTNSTAGDGTTTAIVLGEAIVKEMLKALDEDTSLNPQLVKESVEAEVKLIINELKELAKPIDDHKTIGEVATISANGDREIGDILQQAFAAVGAEGVVTVDEGSTNKTTLEIVEGYQINRGAEAQTRFFNNKEQTRFEAEDVNLVIFDGNLYNYTDVVHAVNVVYGLDSDGQATREIKPIVFLANDFSQEVLQFMLIQKAQAGLTLCAVKGPHTTNVRSAYYQDIAVLTGGEVLGNGGRSIKNMQLDDEGLVGKVVIDKYKCTFYDAQGAEEDILGRVEQLKASKQLAESPYDAQLINDRLAALTSGVAKIGVGGSTEFEIKEKYDRIEDALNASRAAIEEGIVPGGGSTLFRIACRLQDSKKNIGQTILSNALKAPLLQILSNIGVDAGPAVIKPVITDNNIVYDARNKKAVNYLDAGIVDPVKVTRLALENAVSIASLLSTAGGGIVYVRDK